MVGIWVLRASLVAQLVKNLPAMWETWVQSLGWEDPLEKGKTIQSSILAWRIPWTIQSMGSQSQTQLSNFHFTSLHFIPNSLGEANGEERQLQKNKWHTEMIKKKKDLRQIYGGYASFVTKFVWVWWEDYSCSAEDLVTFEIFEETLLLGK